LVAELAKEGKKGDGRALGRAMERVIRYVGDTLLESGKIKMKKDKGMKSGMAYVVERTTSLVVDDGKGKEFGRDERVYVISVDEWYDVKPRGEAHDVWWMRLHVSLLLFLLGFNGLSLFWCVYTKVVDGKSNMFLAVRIYTKQSSIGHSYMQESRWRTRYS
jgi:hypothetical protein